LAGWILFTALACLAACGSERAGSRRFLSVGTAGTGGIYYPLGGAIASRLSLADTNHRYTAEVTGGSVENVQRIAKGEMDFGFSMAVTVFEAYHGGPDFAEPMRGLRVIAPLYPNVTHVIVPGRSAIASVQDLAGRRVSVGSPGSGTEQLARQVLESHAITYEDIEVRYLSFRESADALRDGAVDAAIFSVGYPASAVLEVMTTGNARLLPIDTARQAELTARYTYYRRGSIPAGAYPGLTEDIPTLAVLNWVVAREELDESIVVHLLNVLQHERSQLVEVNAIARQIDLAALESAPIPLHPAAARWFDAEYGLAR
jgi:TRAP transporter TAXI family solute receptor